jgi:CheY-like chemotaxis protein
VETSLAVGTTTRRLLVADPDEDLLARYRVEFADDHCDVVEARDGREAMVKAFVRTPSAVITELRLPILDGLALCEVLRRDTATSHVPLLVVTGEDNEQALARAGRIADGVLRKSGALDTLVAEVHRRLAWSATVQRKSERLIDRVEHTITKSRQAVRRHKRYLTTTPPTPPPALVCPSCDAPLLYVHSYVGGVNGRWPEQWDYFICEKEQARYQFRHRTRKLRPVDPSSA